MTAPISILLCALGGEGGSVLAEWLVEVARHACHPAQATSVPGVAQRTGATTYYLEIYPQPFSALGGQRPVLGLNPLPGRLDALISSELLETSRQIAQGMASSDRTLVISHGGRALTTAEKMVIGDGRVNATALTELVAQHSRAHHVLDMADLTSQAGTVVSAVMLGCIAASDLLPFDRSIYEAVLAGDSASARASQRGFALGHAAITRQREQQRYLEVLLVEPKADAAPMLSADLAAQFPADTHPVLALAQARLIEHQGPAYVALYACRLQSVLQAEQASSPGAEQHPITREVARWLALWMAFDDVIRVADLKSRASRMARLRRETRAAEHDLLKIYDHFKPGVPEIAGLLPPAWAKRTLNWDRRRVAQGRAPWALPIQVATHTLGGWLMLRLLASLRCVRPWGSRYITEQAQIESWLQALLQATRISPALGLEVARCGQLVKGYGSTHDRSRRNLQHILTHGLAGDVSVDEQLERIERWRRAALQDEAGQALDQALAQHGAPARPVSEQPILWMKNPRTGRP
ncbi:MAG: indolepyruvate oxidoreductase subunit beta family protein [Alphaproteobacteria bacterium]|nr:indolepyruvate oxidoreductase subunit beta family protein [Alphaproteobacteria bacterium]